jgi:hypothetical protein
MTDGVLIFADYAFFVLHAALIVFSIVGWAFRRTRLLHLAAFVLTAFSWFVVGPVYFNKLGWCVCTWAHLGVRSELSDRGYPNYNSDYNYVQMLVKKTLGVDLGMEQSEWLAGTVFAFVLVATVITWARVGVKRFRSRSQSQAPAPAT